MAKEVLCPICGASYNLAAIYDSRADTPLHSYEDAVEEVKRVRDGSWGAFSKVFLYIALVPGKVFRVF